MLLDWLTLSPVSKRLTVLLSLCCGLTFPALQSPGREPEHLLGREVVIAWRKAGAEIGWMKADSHWLLFSQGNRSGVLDLPAFQFQVVRKGALASLPSPKVPFGLDLEGTHMIDEAVEDLVHLKTLRALSLALNNVTEARAGRVARLKDLQALDLSRTEVAAIGLGKVACLEKLRVLGLLGTPSNQG